MDYTREELQNIFRDKPDLKKIGEEMSSLVSQMMSDSDMCLFPDKAYCESVGWEVNADGTVDTPGGWRMPTRELWELEKLEQLYKL